MMRTRFEKMPDEARLWVYALNRALDPNEATEVAQTLEAFVASWESHGEPVTGIHEIVEDQFILLSGYCGSGIGGCSTDSSVRIIKEIEQRFGVDAFDRLLVFFRNGGGKLITAPRTDFQEMVRQGHVTAETPVFDTTITTVGDLRGGRFETTFGKSWHARAFG
jgi:hypothetical protein